MSQIHFKLSFFIVVCILLQINCSGSGGSSNISDEILGSLSSSDEVSDGYYYDVIDLGAITSGKTIEMTASPNGFDLKISLLIGENFESADEVATADVGVQGEDETLSYAFDEANTAWIYITSYIPGEIGDYDLSYEITGSSANEADDDGSVETSAVETEEECHGSAYSCSSISGYSGSCSNQDGCNLGFESDGYGGHNPVCEGSSKSCSEYDYESDCEAQQGCSWY